MGIVCTVLEAERSTYRKMVGVPRNNHSMTARMRLKKIPSKSTIVRSYGLIPECCPYMCTRQLSTRWMQGRWQATTRNFLTWG